MKDSNLTETTQHIVSCETDANSLLHNRTASSLNTLLYICSPKCEFLCMRRGGIFRTQILIKFPKKYLVCILKLLL